MGLGGRWVIGPIVAVLVTACSPTSSGLTPPPAAPAGSTSSVGAATAAPSLAASGVPATTGAPQASAQPSMSSLAASATTRPTDAPTPRPTGTPRAAGHHRAGRDTGDLDEPSARHRAHRDRRRRVVRERSTHNRERVLPRVHDRGNLRVPLQHPPRYDRYGERQRVGAPRPTSQRRTLP